MVKIISIPLVVSFLTLLGYLNTDVTIESSMPEMAKAGEEFLVEITINKGDVEGFARFEQELPVGFTAVARETVNGKFEFANQKVKVTWMRVPLDREIVISYAIQVAPSISSGSFDIGGKFSYIQNNGVQAALLTPKSIYIQADAEVAQRAADAQKTYTYEGYSLKNIDCIRQKPYVNDNNEIIVNLLVSKSDLNGFGKIQEQIPRGYKASAIRSKNSIFSESGTVIKFLWMNMPKDKQFVVSYKLTPEEIGTLDPSFAIVGTFSYAENERTHTRNITEQEVDLSNFAGEDLVAENPTETTTDNSDVNNFELDTTENNPEIVSDNNHVEPDNVSNYDMANITSIPTPENGIGYRVQIAAGHNLVKASYFRKLNITDDVQTEIHQGWHKYTVGNFNMYKDARDYRVYVWNNTPIHDAFVAAYNNGMRITVQEALMIANQKWYK